MKRLPRSLSKFELMRKNLGRSLPLIPGGDRGASRLEEASPALLVSRSARLVATIASRWVRTAVTVVIGLVSTPILLRLLGPERFGAVRMVEQCFAYLEFLGFGLAAAVGVLLIRAATSGTAADVSAFAETGIRLLFRQFLWILPAALGLVVVFPIFFGLPANLRAEFYWGAPAILLWISMSPMNVFRLVLEGRQRGYLVDIGLLAQSVVLAGIGIGFAAAGFGLTGQLWTIALGAIDLLLCLHLLGRGDKPAVLVSSGCRYPRHRSMAAPVAAPDRWDRESDQPSVRQSSGRCATRGRTSDRATAHPAVIPALQRCR